MNILSSWSSSLVYSSRCPVCSPFNSQMTLYSQPPVNPWFMLWQESKNQIKPLTYQPNETEPNNRRHSQQLHTTAWMTLCWREVHWRSTFAILGKEQKQNYRFLGKGLEEEILYQRAQKTFKWEWWDYFVCQW